MAHKAKNPNGLSTLSLGLVGGLLLGWGMRRGFIARAISRTHLVPTERPSPSRLEASGQRFRQVEGTEPDTEGSTTQAKSVGPSETPASSSKAASSKPQDLTAIEGIGPKINKVLHNAGITTFAQLAETGVGELDKILKDDDFRLADTSTWPEQAKLAAADDWKALEALQDKLKGGRRV